MSDIETESQTGDGNVDYKSDNGSVELLPRERMGKLGVELVMKAALCAATVALVAGMVAVLFGS